MKTGKTIQMRKSGKAKKSMTVTIRISTVKMLTVKVLPSNKATLILSVRCN